ncbi:hypothetical protein [Micromonospora sp. b486]|uniref:LysE family translocator n=1 Tax=Micromonospora sp. b486 TaxID=3053986 RepID=UPI00259D00CE|nr:hypothetical protein [Micromonospora sp. b486]MDM4784516.1 hypothetical protein [Micromonospora sp. b486]
MRVERRNFHATAQFRRKMAALKKLSDEDRLYKATNPVERDKSITDGYKDRIRQKIWDKYWPHDKDLANRLSQRLSDYHPDHVWELQLGGPDTVGNLKLLHGRTNTDIGSQIWGQMPDAPAATVRMLACGLVFMAVTLLVFAGYVLLAGALRRRVLSRPRLTGLLRHAFAGSFLVLGLGLAFSA